MVKKCRKDTKLYNFRVLQFVVIKTIILKIPKIRNCHSEHSEESSSSGLHGRKAGVLLYSAEDSCYAQNDKKG
jgi:hypothetical protein